MATKAPRNLATIVTLLLACTMGSMLTGCGSQPHGRSVLASFTVADSGLPAPDSRPNLDPDGAPRLAATAYRT